MVEKEMNRRRFLVLASGTVAAAVLAGCIRKEEIDTISAVVQEATATTVPTDTATSVTAATEPPAAAATSSPTATAVPVQQNVKSACPKGLFNDPYPGKCRRYVDNNGNGICDLSEV
jgi:ABC-type uncharacterized transport system auxiliary subunit